MSLPRVRIGRHQVSRLIIGGNPFSGNSHQSDERSAQMLDWYTCDRIKGVLRQCELAGIDTALMRADAHIWRMYREYRNEGGTMQWVAQIAPEAADHERNIDTAVAFGAIGVYVQGAMTRDLLAQGKLDRIRRLVDHIRSSGALAGVGAHCPDELRTVLAAGISADFLMVSFYDCGSIHEGAGEAFRPDDPPRACEFIRQVQTPCLAFKVMAAGRNEPWGALRYAYEQIKPTDAVVVGMFPKDSPTMVADNARFVAGLHA